MNEFSNIQSTSNFSLEKDHSETEPLTGTSIIDFSQIHSRFTLLFFACVLCMGSYYIYDIPAALEIQLKSVLDI